jgi:hypothetical protein
MKKSIDERFISKVREPFDAHNDCWEWTGFKSDDGYGQISLNGKSAKAHRVSYELFVGPIPKGHQIDHMCRNHACVRPDHLQVLPRSENCGQWNRGKSHCKRGHEFNTVNTHEYDGGRYCRICDRERQIKSYWRRKEGC